MVEMNFLKGEAADQVPVYSSKRRTRTRLSDYQKQVLKEAFASSPYLTSTQQTEVAVALGITKQVLQVCNFLLYSKLKSIIHKIGMTIHTFYNLLGEKCKLVFLQHVAESSVLQTGHTSKSHQTKKNL